MAYSTSEFKTGLKVIVDDDPCTIIENEFVKPGKGQAFNRVKVRNLKTNRVIDKTFKSGESPFTSYKLREGKDVTIVATSIMVLEALRAADFLMANSSIDCEIIDLNCVSNPDISMILQSVKKTGKLLIADTSWKGYGVCAEICRLICETDPSSLRSPVATLGMAPVPCPTAKSLENIFYPNLGVMVDTIANLVTGLKDHGIPLPDERSMRDVYKEFKGPF